MLLLITVEYQAATVGLNTFEILSLTDNAGNDFKYLIGYDDRFCSFTEVREHISRNINMPIEEIELEEV